MYGNFFGHVIQKGETAWQKERCKAHYQKR